MRDLGVLKERIEYAERHLSASHSARERESQALMAMWRQIRDRFEAQEQEITRYRAQLAEMTNVNDELSSLVDRLIQSVEGGIADSGNETVPEIARLADDLLQSQPASRPVPDYSDSRTESPVPNRAPSASAAIEPAPEAHIPAPEEILELDTPADPPFSAGTAGSETGSRSSFGASLEAALSENIDDDEDDDLSIPQSAPVAKASASEGIRDLISRIETAVATPDDRAPEAGAAETGSSEDDEDEDLTRELQEIEALRSELNGLRNKISAGN